MNFYLLLVVCATASFVYALECGLTNNLNREELRAVDVCMKPNKSKENQSEEHNISKESSDEGGFDITDDVYGYRRRHRRSDDENDSDNKENDEEQDENQNNNDTDRPDKCIVKCILDHLHMTNAEGYPDHGKVSQALLRSAQGRELRDFLQDSADECFRLIEQGEHVDSCSHSAQLVKCLYEKGKSNCSDWPAGELPFAHVL